MGNSTTTTVNIVYIYLRRTTTYDDHSVINIFEADKHMNVDYHH